MDHKSRNLKDAYEHAVTVLFRLPLFACAEDQKRLFRKTNG